MADILILDEDFANFDLEFLPEDDDDHPTNNNINLPDPFGSQEQQHPSALELVTPHAQYHPSTTTTATPTPIMSQPPRDRQVRFSFHNDDGSGSAADHTSKLTTDLDEIDHDDPESTQTMMSPNHPHDDEIVMPAEDFFGLDPESDFQAVQGEDQLLDYYHHLAAQLAQDREDGVDNTGFKYPSDEDGDWQEHDQHNLDHIVFQDDSVKIKTKPTTITVLMSKSGPSSNPDMVFGSQINVNGSGVPKKATTLPLGAVPDDIAKLLALPIGSLNSQHALEPPTRLQLNKIDPNKLATLGDSSHNDADEIAAQLQLQESMVLPARVSRHNAVAPVPPAKNDLVSNQTIANGNHDEVDFAVAFDQAFLSPEELVEYDAQRKALQRAHLASQRQRLHNRIIADPIQLQSQQDHFLNKIDQFEVKVDSLWRNNPMLMLRGDHGGATSTPLTHDPVELNENQRLTDGVVSTPGDDDDDQDENRQ